METNRNKKITLIALLILVLGAAVIYFVNRTKTVVTMSEAPATDITENKTAKKDEDAQILFATNSVGENAYKIEKDGKWCVIFQGVEGKCYDSVSRPIFSSDGKQFAYAAENDGRWVVVLNNSEETMAYDGVSSIVFSPDGTSVAIVAEKGEKELVIADGAEGKEYEDISTLETWSGPDGQVVFSPDGEEIAYKVEEEGQEMVVIDGEEGKKYDEIGNFDFSEDSEQFAYEAETGDEDMIVIDGRETAAKNESSSPSAPATPPAGSETSSVSSGNANSGGKPRFTVCEKNMATGEECNF